jgi:cytochrome P450
MKQRKHLSEAFLPLSSLAAILPKSLERAKLCATLLAKAAAGGTAVDMSDFLLHEAQAQLQCALLGAPNDLMEATNAKIRATFAGDLDKGEISALSNAMKGLMEVAKDPNLALPTDGCPVRGPLSRAVATSELPASANYGNMLLILFAGHDTTGHTMTWLLFELARNPSIQKELQREVDGFYSALSGRDPDYRDLAKLELLDRCVTETLRMWPAVANGTFRQLQYPDTVRGPGGEDVELPRGTSVQVVNWARHRNPELWGSDVDHFNPHREFAEEELARVGCPHAAMNPQSERFSPFTYQPRSCLGRNFAQMEMRLIMLNLLHRFDFSLAAPYDKLAGATLGATPDDSEFRGLNGATMGPMDMEKSTTHWWGTKNYNGIKLHATERFGGVPGAGIGAA